MFLFFSGDIKSNPGPTNFTVCTHNISSILQPVHSAVVSDLIDCHHADLVCLTETWIKPFTTITKLFHCTPSNYTLVNFPRSLSGNTSAIGGGTGFLIRNLSQSYLLLAYSQFSSLSTALLLSNYIIVNCLFSIFIVLHSFHLSLSLSLSFLMIFLSFCLWLLLHLRSSSLMGTLIYTLIITLIFSHLSFFSSPPSISGNM